MMETNHSDLAPDVFVTADGGVYVPHGAPAVVVQLRPELCECLATSEAVVSYWVNGALREFRRLAVDLGGPTPAAHMGMDDAAAMVARGAQFMVISCAACGQAQIFGTVPDGR